MYIRISASIDINFDFIFYIPVDSVIKSLRGLPWLNPAEVCTYVQYFKKAVLNSVPPDSSCIPHVFFTFCCCFCHCFNPINILWFQKLAFPLKALIINLKISIIFELISLHFQSFSYIDVYYQLMQPIPVYLSFPPFPFLYPINHSPLSILLIIPLYLSC